MNQNILLDALTKQIVQFFEAKHFGGITELETETGYQIIADDSPKYKIQGEILVTIEGKPEDFSVAIELCKEEKARSFSLPITLTTMFGGGYFLLRHLRSDESWLTFRRDFWENMNNILTKMKTTGPSKEKKDF